MSEDGRKISVVIDDREARSGLPEIFAALEEVKTSFRRLPVGDYEVEGRFLFERKNLPDFALSIRDGRLFRQAARLTAQGKRSALILEGRGRDLAGCGMGREAIQGALITISLFFGIPVLRALDPKEMARLLCYTARQGRRFATAALPRRGMRPKGRRKRQLALLQGLPGIGPARAARLLETFGSVEGVMTAGLEDLSSVHGLGKSTAEAIRWVLKEPPSTYLPIDDDLFL